MVKYNSNYGKLVTPCLVESDGVPVKRSDELALAPHQIVTATRAIPCPTADVYAEHGFLPIIRTTERVASAGHELVRVGWEERDGAIYGVWEERELPPPAPRHWTPLTIMRGLKAAGMWDALKAGVSPDEMYEFVACSFVSEDDPLFVIKRDAMYAAIGKERVDAFLDGLEVEP